jgi:protein subunit release factor A
MGYRRVKPSEMIDAKYMWNGRAGKKRENILPIGENVKPLNETRYSQFKKQTEIINPSSQMHEAMKEIRKRLQEVNKIAKYTSQLKAELSEANNVQYKKRTEDMLEKLREEVISLYKNVKNLKNG